MTFLEWLMEKSFGPPARRCGNGESYWVCPFHNDTHPSFHTMPDRPEYKHRFICFGCGLRGDCADLLAQIYPAEKWPARRARLERLRGEYEAEHGCNGAPSQSYDFSSSGDSGTSKQEEYHDPALISVQAMVFADDMACGLPHAYDRGEVPLAVALDVLGAAERACRHAVCTLPELIEAVKELKNKN